MAATNPKSGVSLTTLCANSTVLVSKTSAKGLRYQAAVARRTDGRTSAHHRGQDVKLEAGELLEKAFAI